MRKVKILHCADLHFDTPFKELSNNIAEKSRLELLDVFKNIIDLTIKEKIEVLLIAGDIFDNLTVNKSTLFFIANELERIKNVYVFIAPGNHDPYNNKSFYKMIKWPENVFIFKGDMEKIEVEELNLTVWGAGFQERYERDTLIKVKDIDKSSINIMVIHGEIIEGNSKNEYNPIYISDLEKSNIDYIAIGHRHRFSGILNSGLTSYGYSGCPQGRGFDEDGDKGVIIGDVYKGGTSLIFRETALRRYISKEINISGINTYDELIKEILSGFEENERMINFYKIILKGQIKDHFSINESILEDKLKNKFYYIKIVDKTDIEINIDELSLSYSLKGRFISKLIEKINSATEEEKEIYNLALKIGIQSMSEEEVNLNDY